MTGDELRTLVDLLGKFRTAHAPMWIRPHVSALRRLARTLADAAPLEPDPDATLLTELVRWMADEMIRFDAESGELMIGSDGYELEWWPLTWVDVPDHLLAPLQAVFGVVLPGPVHGPPAPPRPPWRQGFRKVDLTYDPVRTGMYRPTPDLRFSSLVVNEAIAVHDDYVAAMNRMLWGSTEPDPDDYLPAWDESGGSQ